MAELTNACIPFISIPLPSSADDHQLKNAIFYKKKFWFLVEEKELNDKLFNIIKDIYNNSLVFNQIVQQQSQYSDKDVYKNINFILEKIIDEKN